MKESLKRLRQASYEMIKDKLVPAFAAIWLGYQKVAGLDINVDITGFDKETKKEVLFAVSEFENLVITGKQDYGLQRAMLYKWGNALLPLLKKSNPSSGGGNGEFCMLLLYLPHPG